MLRNEQGVSMETAKTLDDKYEILEEIKRGGFGVIYYGRDRLFNKPIAVKAISPDLIGNAKYIDIFQAESLAIARLNHQNIVRIYDIKRVEDGQFYIIMEYIDGVDLGRLISAGRKEQRLLPHHLSAYVVAETCAGLDYAHARRDPDTHQPLNIVHRDISPGNIMINRFGEIKIIDFGLANARRHGLRATGKKGEVLIQGKIAYIAPEQINGAAQIDHRADIFSLGLVLYEGLTGRRMFDGRDPKATIARLRAGDWDLTRLEEMGVPESLIAIVNRALQKNPDNRYQSANQMYVDLMNYLATSAPATDYAKELGEMVQALALPRDFDHNWTADQLSAEATGRPVEIEDSRATPAQPEPVRPASTETPSPEPAEIPELEATTAYGFIEEDFVQEAEPGGAPAEIEVQPQPEDAESLDEVPSPAEDVAFYKVLEEEEEEEELRTIIDVVRLSARSHKKEIVLGLAGLTSAMLIFAVVDTFARWTSVGSSIYDFFFPPAIRLISFPPNAQVYLDDEPLPKTTPLAIERISPGVHKLMLTLPRFDPIVRSIRVPSKGKASIAGESDPGPSQPYVFRFKTILEITSKPEAAEVYLNGIKYTQVTPCRVAWEVGDPLIIEMRKPGLRPLRGFTLNTLNGVETIEDRRFWHFERIDEHREYYAVAGTFSKVITISSIPRLAEITVNGGKNIVGLTGYTEEIQLPIGVHSITLQKAGYLPKSFTITVDENSPDRYSQVLSRVVRIFAKDVADTGDNDIGAKIEELRYKGRQVPVKATTPCELTLLPFKYTAVLRKAGYEDYTLDISASRNVAIARMQLAKVPTEILVLNAETDLPLAEVQITYEPLQSDNAELSFFGQTDQQGSCAGDLVPGSYRLYVEKLGYRPMTQEVHVTVAERSRLVVRLSPEL